MRPGGAALLFALACAPAAARDLATAPDGEPVVLLRSSAKATLVLSRAPDDPWLFPDRYGASALWRLRFEPELRPRSWLTLDLAYEQRALVAPSGEALASAFLPPEAAAPWRLRPFDDALLAARGVAWRHELDRASAAVRAGRVSVTAGRQAVGWGRGLLFTAVDVFAPFSPLEIDREWRRGIDAVRAEVRVTGAASVEAVAAGDGSAEGSILAGRARGLFGRVDAELVGGRRARDLFAGATASAPLLDAEVHGELAFFRTPGPLPDAPLANPRLAPKAVLGASYQVDVGRGLLLAAEWHYTGFGARTAPRLVALLTDPAWQARLARGDEQSVERQAAAFVASYPLGDEGTATLQWLHAPADGSGVVAPALGFDVSDRAHLSAGLFLPYGRAPRLFTLPSLYGASPLAGFAMISVED